MPKTLKLESNPSFAFIGTDTMLPIAAEMEVVYLPENIRYLSQSAISEIKTLQDLVFKGTDPIFSIHWTNLERRAPKCTRETRPEVRLRLFLSRKQRRIRKCARSSANSTLDASTVNMTIAITNKDLLPSTTRREVEAIRGIHRRIQI